MVPVLLLIISSLTVIFVATLKTSFLIVTKEHYPRYILREVDLTFLSPKEIIEKIIEYKKRIFDLSSLINKDNF